MSRHPIRLLVPAFLAAVLLGFCIWLTARALSTDADSIAVVAIVGALLFGYRVFVEARQVWKPFAAQLEQRRALRRSAPLTRINIRKDDIR